MNTKQIESIERLLEEHHLISDEMTLLDERLTKVKKTLMEKLESAELETLTVGEEGSEIKVTIVRPTTLKLNEAGLEKELSAAQWKLITKKVVDKKALEDAVVRGKIDPTVVADNSNEVASKPYLRITG